MMNKLIFYHISHNKRHTIRENIKLVIMILYVVLTLNRPLHIITMKNALLCMYGDYVLTILKL